MTLMYHNIAGAGQEIAFREWQPAYDVSHECFGWQLLLFERLARGKQQLCLTFDDGYASVHRLVAPLLALYDFRRIVFVTTEVIGQRGMLSRQQIRELAEMQFEIGVHSHSHVFLEHLSPRQLEAEIRDPQKQLEDLVGAAVVNLSLPGGRYDRKTLAYAAECGMRSVFTSVPGAGEFHLKDLPQLALIRRCLVSDKTPLWQLEKLVSRNTAFIAKQKGLYHLGRTGKRLLGNSGYHRVWQSLQRMTHSF